MSESETDTESIGPAMPSVAKSEPLIRVAVIGLLVAAAIWLVGQRGNAPVVTIDYDTVLVVLGNEPLDANTPTIDMVSRVKEAVAFQLANTNAVLLMTGGATIGTKSEARMMAEIATEMGVSPRAIILEERAMRTDQNARFAAELLAGTEVTNIIVVSKSEHLDWAMPEFRRYEVFTGATTLASDVGQEAIMFQMTEYLKTHPENDRVRARLQSLKDGQHGAD